MEELVFKCNECGQVLEVAYDLDRSTYDVIKTRTKRCPDCESLYLITYNGTTLEIEKIRRTT